jgi:23S rRNA maturation-related 3'-5' exoribonuclease YhaM
MPDSQMEMLVKSVSTSMTKANKPYLRLDLRGVDRKDYQGVVWENAEKLSEIIKIGNVYVFDADVTQYNGALQYTIFAAEQVKDPDFTLFMDPSPVDPVTITSDLFSLLSNVKTPFYKNVISAFMGNKSLRKKLWTVPATLKYHHSYAGGLVHYIYRCVDLAGTICAKYEEIDKDLLLTACFFHDIGKMFEFELVGATFASTTAGKLLGHTNLSMGLLNELIKDKVSACNPEEIPEYLKLQHVIFAHHSVEGDARSWAQTFMALKEGELLIRIASICVILGHYETLSPEDNNWSGDGKKYLG